MIRGAHLILRDLRGELNVSKLSCGLLILCVCLYVRIYVCINTFFVSFFLLSIAFIYNIDGKDPADALSSIINVPQRPAVEMVHQSMKRNRDLFFLSLSFLYILHYRRTRVRRERYIRITILKKHQPVDGWWAIYSSTF